MDIPGRPSLIESLAARLRSHPKRLVFPEGADPRVLQAARLFAREELGTPILLGDRAEIKDRATRLDLRLDHIRILEPERSEDFDLFLPIIQDLKRFSSFDIEQRREVLQDKNYFAACMLVTGRADAVVSGAGVRASSALRPLFQIVPLQAHVRSASSLLILDQENSKIGQEGLLFLADCGVIPEPTAEQLADIAVTTADLCGHLVNVLPRVAMLSFATHSRRMPHPSIARIREAISLAREKAARKGVTMEIDGELQVDAALLPEVAEQKGVAASQVGGKANVLIFPDLNSANIGAKLVQAIAKTRTYGQIITGLSRPAAEISRGAHAHDIYGSAVIVGAQAIEHRLLFGTELPNATTP